MVFNRKYGIEIECMLPRTESMATVAAAIAAAGVPCFNAGYSHSRSAQWKVVSDGSLSGGNGMEIVSPPLQGETSLEQINKVCAVLNRLGATVNRTCGLHVHVDAAGLTVQAMRRLAAIYIENENIIDSFMPMSRRASNNHFCGSLRGTNMTALATARDASAISHAVAHGNRYVKLNFSAFLRHGTVEFRHHSGTVDADKINKWLLTCLRLVACAVKEADLPIAAGSAFASARPTGRSRSARRLAIIYDLMQRPGGCSRQDVAVVLQRRTLPPMNRILRGAGFTYRITHQYGDRRTERYVLSAERVASTTAETPAPVTFDAFCARIEMPEGEKQFWINRQLAVARTTLTSRAA